MLKNRFQKAKFNACTTLLYQIVAVVCGVLIPRVIIGQYGSAVYGITTSITQFLSYITLLEGGIGGVARAELYSPLAEENICEISKIYNAIKHYFKLIGCVFVIYALVLAGTYHKITEVSFFEPVYTFLLVLIIGMSTVAQYFWGIANQVLLNADQKRYISNIVMIVTTAVNAGLVIVLVLLGCDILTVKLCSSVIFVLRPILFSLYVKRHYRIEKNQKPGKDTLSQKWTGLGQHLAYCLHKNTDVVVLTVFADVTFVAVYSVYHLVISSITSIVTSLTGGMEAVFGDMLARKEHDQLVLTYRYYELLVSFAAVVLFGVTSILILPFVKLYTAGIHDFQYIQPLFAFTLILAEAINCIFVPCATIPVAANKFRETKWGAYGEVLINLTSSCILVLWNPLVGVAVGTLLATLYKNTFYFYYVSKNIFHTSLSEGRKYILHIGLLVALMIVGNTMMRFVAIDSFVHWGFWGFVVCACVTIVALCSYSLMYGKFFIQALCKLLGKFLNKR